MLYHLDPFVFSCYSVIPITGWQRCFLVNVEISLNTKQDTKCSMELFVKYVLKLIKAYLKIQTLKRATIPWHTQAKHQLHDSHGSLRGLHETILHGSHTKRFTSFGNDFQSDFLSQMHVTYFVFSKPFSVVCDKIGLQIQHYASDNKIFGERN